MGAQNAETVAVPRATYNTLCSIVRLWDAWLLTGKQDDELRRAAARATAEWCGSEAGARAEDAAQFDGSGEG
jgi:hypothetical protein